MLTDGNPNGLNAFNQGHHIHQEVHTDMPKLTRAQTLSQTLPRLLIILCVNLTSCSVWETETIEPQTYKDPTEKPLAVSGQPYFLPKALIHLVVTPVSSADSSASSSGASSASSATAGTLQLPTGGSATISQAPRPAAPSGTPVPASSYTADFLLEYPKPAAPPPPPPPPLPKIENHVVYKVTAEIKLVPDRKAGVFYGHYSPNWLFSDNVSISTTPEGLLSAVSSSSEDRTPQVFSNLAETAIDVGEFLAAGGIPALGAFSTDSTGGKTSTVLNSMYKMQAGSDIFKEGLPTKAATLDAINAARKKVFHLNQIKDRLDLFKKTYAELKSQIDISLKKVRSGDEIYVKRLNIDECFDPFDDADYARIQSLFADNTSKELPAPEYSPVKLDIQRPATPASTSTLPNGRSQQNGLCFREPTQVEIVLRSNSDCIRQLRTKVISRGELATTASELILQKDKAAYLSGYATDLLAQIKNNIIELESLWVEPTPATAPPAPSPTLPPKPTDVPAPLVPVPKLDLNALDFLIKDLPGGSQDVISSETELETALKNLSEAQQAILQVKPSLDHYAGDVDQLITALTSRANTNRDQSYYGNLRGEVAGLGRFSFTVPNKGRSFMLNVPRSAFVLRSMTMAIQNGVLLGFSHMKPSEVEGFTTIPLTLAEKLAAVPRSLFQAKNDSLQGQDSIIKSRTQLINDQRTLNSTIRNLPVQPAATLAP